MFRLSKSIATYGSSSVIQNPTPLISRLYDAYAANEQAGFYEKEYEKWETDVNNYLWWITTELELRRTKCERKWGGAW